MSRHMLCHGLEQRGHTVTAAESGQQALELVKAGHFDVVLLDIVMPEMDGFEILEIIRQTYTTRELPVIMVTAKAESEDIVRGLNLGGNDYVAKPIDLSVISARIQAQLVLKRAVEALRESEEQFRDLYENAPIAYFSVGIDGCIWQANQGAVELFGYRADELLGRSMADLFQDSREGREKAEMFRRIGVGGEIRLDELEMRRADSGLVWISLIVHPVRDAAGAVVGSRAMALETTDRKRAEQALLDEVKSRHNYEEIIGESASIQRILKQIEPVAPTDATVLVLGETGTGKELICRAIHHLSSRRPRPLIKLNCAAIPPGLVESELFGHEQGAFTGAISQKQGRFELAHGGTIFLDEIGDLPLEVQAKLLRVLEDREFERVGGTLTIKLDTRVIAATHRDLEQMVQEGGFRQDLYYRLNVFPIKLSPLRDRNEDIPLLVSYFIRRICARLGQPSCELSDAALERLQAYDWPGNVRELENIIERAVILCRGRKIDREHIQVEAAEPSAVAAEIQPLQALERGHIIAALQAANGKVGGAGGAAQLLGLKPSTLQSRMKKLGIIRRDSYE